MFETHQTLGTISMGGGEGGILLLPPSYPKRVTSDELHSYNIVISVKLRGKDEKNKRILTFQFKCKLF